MHHLMPLIDTISNAFCVDKSDLQITKQDIKAPNVIVNLQGNYFENDYQGDYKRYSNCYVTDEIKAFIRCWLTMIALDDYSRILLEYNEEYGVYALYSVHEAIPRELSIQIARFKTRYSIHTIDSNSIYGTGKTFLVIM